MSSEKENQYNEELELLFGAKTNLRVAHKDTGVYPSQIVLDRNAFLRRLNKVSLGFAVFLGLVVVSLAIGLNISANRPVQTLAYLLDSKNNMTELQPTNIPSVTDEDVMIFAVKKVKQFHKLSFTDYIEHTVSLEREFTTHTAFENYQRSLLNSLILTQIRDDRLSSWAEPSAAPEIINFNEDTLTWQVRLNFTWYMGGGKQQTNGREYTVDFLIKRVSRKHNEKGLAVDAYFIKPVGGE